MEAIKRPAPAKINLALDILGPRPDGYHEMRMVMQTVSLCDTVTLAEGEAGFSLDTDGDFLPAGEKTLEQQAAESFFRELGRPCPPLSVGLEKRPPAYAGLGSDMPFCVRGGTVLAEGRGEILTDLPPLPPCWLAICKPDFSLPTGEMFAKVRGRIFQSRPDIDGMARALGAGRLEGVAKRLYNVFEEVLPAETREEIQGIKTAMRCCGALNAAMSGSGPAMFGIFLKEEEAAAAAESLRTWCGQTFLVQPVERLDGPVV